METLHPISFKRHWDAGNVSRIPYSIYCDPEIYQREQERIFNGPHWSYVALAIEVPRPGDFKRSWIGERSVIVLRDRDGAINVVENRCAHRGIQFCQENFGNYKAIICPYHQWSYDLKGDLKGLPFRRGVKGKGGMPQDFKLEQHGLTKLRVEVHNGVVFASFSPSVPDFKEYIGPTLLPYFERLFDGRELKILGYSRQRIPGNWKLIQENIKDPYHAGLLHTWFVTLGLWRADNESQLLMDDEHRHAAMVSQRGKGGTGGEVTAGVASFREDMKLNDERILDVVPEPWWKGPTAVMMTIFPSLIIQQNVNSLSTRQIIPREPGVFDFVWTFFGFADDTPEMTQRRLRQANLFGPAGYVSADDGEVVECSQDGLHQYPDEHSLVELGGREVENTDHMVSETLIRGMYEYYRKVMEI
jgi:salicylate 5-hydroxylase large subunit